MKLTSFKNRRNIFVVFFLFITIIVSIAYLVSCSGGDGGSSTGAVSTTISDPPTCQDPNGLFKNTWVTITRVRAHTSGNADPNGSGWVDLVDLRNKPMQIDLLNLSSTTCLLTQLGSTGGIPVGKYQQIRLYLMSNTPDVAAVKPATNHCGSNGYNCVVLADNSIDTLQLGSESQTGIKIPPGQIAGGGLTVLAGQSVDLNIDFDACSSIVQEGDGKYRLKPTLRAGEITLNTSSISGRVIDKNTKLPIAGALVLVETRDTSTVPNIDRVVSQKLTGSDGKFIFCPLSAATYDIVVAAKTASATYNATVTLTVSPGQDTGDIPLSPETGGTLPATISGKVKTSTGAVATSADVSLSALQSITLSGGGSLLVTVPLLFVNPSSSLNVDTGGIDTCGIGTGSGCATYILSVPASNPVVGEFSTSSLTSYAAPSAGDVVFKVNAQAFVPMSGGLQDCSPSSQTTPAIVVLPGLDTPIAPILFTGCS